MTVSDFWNRSFLAALHRLPAEEAKVEADRATEMCIKHWKTNFYDYVPVATHQKDMDITVVYHNPE